MIDSVCFVRIKYIKVSTELLKVKFSDKKLREKVKNRNKKQTIETSICVMYIFKMKKKHTPI